ncbi:MAG: hypothetical protein IPI53_10095 [Saprospiraceae bacterium]|nr:hypothetical protein [Saprospiraceae bacterium]
MPNLLIGKVFATILFFSLFFTSCTHKQVFLTSSKVPAARGNVKIKIDKNKNHSIEVSLINLAEPSRLSPAKSLYIVWMETDQKVIKNIGQIITDNGSFSKTLKAEFKTVTSFTPIKVFITAENDANVQFPDYDVVISTARF